MAISPGRLLDIEGVGDPVSVCQENFEITTEETYKFHPTYQSGVVTTLIGPPTSGTRILDERWKDAWNGEFRCTVAGTPGTWRQEKAAIRAGEPSSGTIPTGYIIEDSTDAYRRKVHMGSYVWRYVHAPARYGELTGLTGGGSLNLDGVVTTTLDVGTVAEFLVSGALYSYRLKSGTAAEVSPWVVRPDDYAASTNEKVWERITRADYPGDTVRELTGLTGGTSVDLNYIPTVDLAVGALCWFLISGNLVAYRLRAASPATESTQSPTIIRPADFSSVTNQKIWERVMIVGEPGDVMIGDNNLSEISTTATKRTASRSNLDVLWADDSRVYGGAAWPSKRLMCLRASTNIAGAAAMNLGLFDFSIFMTVLFDNVSTLPSTTVLFESHDSGNNRVKLRAQGVSSALSLRLDFTDNGGSTTTYTMTPDVALEAYKLYAICVTADRNGNATAYINGTSDRDASGAAVTVDISGSSAVDIGSANANVWEAMEGSVGLEAEVGAIVVYNRALTSADVGYLARNASVNHIDCYGSFTATYTANWSAGVDSFTGSGVTVAGNIDAISDGSTSKDNNLRITTDATSGAHTATRATTLTAQKRYKIDIVYYIPSGQTFDTLVIACATSLTVIATLATVGVWTTTSVEITSETAATSLVIYASDGSSTFYSWTSVNGEVAYVNSLVVTQVGAILDLECDTANAAQSTAIRDRAGLYNATLTAATTTAVNALKQLNPSRISVGTSTVLSKLISATATLDFASIAAAASADLTITVTGAVAGDAVAIGLPTAPAAGLVFFGFVSAADTVTIRAMNITALAVDAASATYRATVFQFA